MTSVTFCSLERSHPPPPQSQEVITQRLQYQEAGWDHWEPCRQLPPQPGVFTGPLLLLHRTVCVSGRALRDSVTSLPSTAESDRALAPGSALARGNLPCCGHLGFHNTCPLLSGCCPVPTSGPLLNSSSESFRSQLMDGRAPPPGRRF